MAAKRRNSKGLEKSDAMNKISVSAPGKLMLFGEHAVVYNHPCLVTAVDQRMRATVSLLENNEFQLEASDVQVSNYSRAWERRNS